MPKVKVKRKKGKVVERTQAAKRADAPAVGSRRPPGDGFEKAQDSRSPVVQPSEQDASEVAGAVPSPGASNASGTIEQGAVAIISDKENTSAIGDSSTVARQVRSQVQLGNEGQEGIPVAAAPSAARPSAATEETTAPAGETEIERKKRKNRERARLQREEARAERAARPQPRPNPLLDLKEELRDELFRWMRQCQYNDVLKQMLAEKGIPGVTNDELKKFFDAESENHWQRRLERAATEANSLVSYVEKNAVEFSGGILAALGQEAFRQIANGDMDAQSITRITNLFLKARGDERAGQSLALRRENYEQAWRTKTETALEQFATELETHPEARAAFEMLRAKLMNAGEEPNDIAA